MRFALIVGLEAGLPQLDPGDPAVSDRVAANGRLSGINYENAIVVAECRAIGADTNDVVLDHRVDASATADDDAMTGSPGHTVARDSIVEDLGAASSTKDGDSAELIWIRAAIGSRTDPVALDQCTGRIGTDHTDAVALESVDAQASNNTPSGQQFEVRLRLRPRRRPARLEESYRRMRRRWIRRS